MAVKITKGKQARPAAVLLYGTEGIGKTTLCASLPGAFLIDTEGGSAFLDCDRVNMENLADISEVLKYIITEKKAGTFPYSIIVLDTADKIWQWGAARVIENTPNAKSIEDIPYGKGYSQSSELFNRVIYDGFISKLKSIGLHVIVCAHSKIAKISPPDAAEYTQYQVKITAPNAQAQEAANLLRQGCDAVLFAHFETDVYAKKGETVGKAIAERRVISTTHSAQWEAKNRIGLPEKIEMTAEALMPLFPDLTGNATPAPAPATRQNAGANAGATEAPRDPEAGRGMNAAPPRGADPDELGGYARHHGLDTRAPQPEPAPQPAPAPAPAPEARPTLPASFQGLELYLCYYLQSKGKLNNNQTHIEDIPDDIMRVIVKNEAAILRDVKRYKENKAPF